jgi:excinuclease ABC subunit B
MYADRVTNSMERAINETNRRRALQTDYNETNHITPKSIIKGVRDIIDISSKEEINSNFQLKRMSAKEKERVIEQLMKEMKNAAKLLEFEHAAFLRDRIKQIREEN